MSSVHFLSLSTSFIHLASLKAPLSLKLASLVQPMPYIDSAQIDWISPLSPHFVLATVTWLLLHFFPVLLDQSSKRLYDCFSPKQCH